MEDYKKNMKPYYKAYDRYMNSFVCEKCNGDKIKHDFMSDRNSFTFVNSVDVSELWNCNKCKTDLETIKKPLIDDFYVPDIEVFSEDDVFNKDYMKSIGFKVIKDDGKCGKAVDIRTNGMTVLSWNRSGPGVTYFGEDLGDDTYYLGIGKDGGSRTVFNGYIFSREDMEKILSLTW